MEREMFEEMIRDWQADNAEEYGSLEITEVVEENGSFKGIAEDENNTYSLTDDGTGNIKINYLASK